VPELPEIIAHAERLSAAYAGGELAAFKPLHMTALKTFDPSPAAVVGLILNAVGYRGKHLLLRFGRAGESGASQSGVVVGDASQGDLAEPAAGGQTSGDAGRQRLTFVVHLMQAGRLRPDEAQRPRPRGGMARWVFADGRALLLTEAGKERRAGVWLVAGDPCAREPLSRLGPDADRVSRAQLDRKLASAGRRVHGFLRDQTQLAGIGRLLANEILHAARLSPFANTARLDGDAVGRLHQAIGASLSRGLAAERKRKDMGRSKDRPSDVHHRVGRPCTACGDVVRSVEYRRYRVAYCPACQTGGKVLADNTTSRFLK